ncbi:hypothetical protein Pint_28498 [Pistacia integerrima]|uniref:Uncharacterized protein n=1 Tax=Pistacia integerrima TaxID=434235 RepID=A0ACC0YQM1_9ROSI|nr:hypothetical protein Pint_28498 [Pistacia integerrima]
MPTLLAPFGFSHFFVSSQIDSYSCDLKPQREGEKAEKERKERKKERKLEKKEKEKVWGSGAVESKKHRHKKRPKDDRNQEDQKGGGLQKKTKNELEKSSLTKEHGHPVGSQNSSDKALLAGPKDRS